MADMSPWMPWCQPGYSMEMARDWTAARPKLFSDRIEFDFVITREDGRFLGGCGLNQMNYFYRFSNLGYWVRSSEAGKGVAVQAVRLTAAFAFEKTLLNRLELLIAAGNDRSCRVAEKAGALLEGVLRDRIFLDGQSIDAKLYSFTRRTWPPPLHV
jgi:RimJ/RimL family protein N-acetyltransferase